MSSSFGNFSDFCVQTAQRFHLRIIVPMIIGEIRRHLRDNNTIRVSRSTRDLAYKSLSARERLSRALGREPSTAEIAASLCGEDFHCTESDVSDALEAIAEPLSLFDPVYNDGSSDSVYLMDQISDSSCCDDNWVESIALGDAMRSLSEREKSILRMRFFRGKTQMEIAGEIGISQAQVSRLEKSALAHIRSRMT